MAKTTPETLAPDTLELLQRVLGVNLPQPYRAHLMAHNGQRPEARRFRYDRPDGGSAESTLHHLYAVNSANSYDDLWTVNSRFREELGPDHLLIGDDDGGAKLVLAVKGRDYGKVLFWDTDHPPSGGMYPVAGDFAAFLDGLTD